MAHKPTAAPALASPPIGHNSTIILTDPDIIAAVAEYTQHSRAESLAEKRKPGLKLFILGAIGDAPHAVAGSLRVEIIRVPAEPCTPDRVITRDDIGKVTPGKRGRAAYAQIIVRDAS